MTNVQNRGVKHLPWSFSWANLTNLGSCLCKTFDEFHARFVFNQIQFTNPDHDGWVIKLGLNYLWTVCSPFIRRPQATQRPPFENVFFSFLVSFSLITQHWLSCDVDVVFKYSCFVVMFLCTIFLDLCFAPECATFTLICPNWMNMRVVYSLNADTHKHPHKNTRRMNFSHKTSTPFHFS